MARVLVLTTSYNRRENTIRFLESIDTSFEGSNISFEVIVVDDFSNDGTIEALKSRFSGVRIINGNGFLYWAGALRLGIAEAVKILDQFDGVLIANDDVTFKNTVLKRLVELGNSHSAMVGGVVMSRGGKVEATGYKFGFICRPKYRRIQTRFEYAKCDVLPGHVLYIPKDVFRRLIPLSKKFSHGFADFELSFKAKELNVDRLILGEVVGFVDEIHDYAVESRSIKLDFRLAVWRLRFNPKAPPFRETIIYLRNVSKFLWMVWLPFFYFHQFVSLLKCIRLTGIPKKFMPSS